MYVTLTLIQRWIISLTKLFLQKIKEQATKSKFSTDLKKQMDVAITYVKDQLEKYLVPFNKGPTLHELFVFDDVKSVRQHIMGAPRAVVHTALQNPHIYLQVNSIWNSISFDKKKYGFCCAQCPCCALDDPTQIIPTLPDISVAFKLHLESGQMINLFDWLQVKFVISFVTLASCLRKKT